MVFFTFLVTSTLTEAELGGCLSCSDDVGGLLPSEYYWGEVSAGCGQLVRVNSWRPLGGKPF